MGQVPTIPPGTVLGGDFQIVQPLAAGGMGAVYVAVQRSTGKTRALKVMRPELLRDQRLRERFAQEARVGAHIKSHHVVEVVAAGIDPGSGAPWIAMELLEGVDLAQYLRTRGALPAGETAAILGQAGHALASAHQSGIVHRDLKPENLFVAHSHQRGAASIVKVLDFGVAKVLAEAQAGSAETTAVGTPRWMAPEQTEGGHSVTPATDVWALGLLAFHMLTGHYYWRLSTGEGASVPRLLREILFEPLVPASVRATELGVGARLPSGFDAWFARCVARDASQRYQEAGAAIAALERVLGEPGPLPASLPAGSTGGAASPAARSLGSVEPAMGVATTGGLSQSAAKPPGRRGLWIAMSAVGVAACIGLGVVGFVYRDALTGGSSSTSKSDDDGDDRADDDGGDRDQTDDAENDDGKSDDDKNERRKKSKKRKKSASKEEARDDDSDDDDDDVVALEKTDDPAENQRRQLDETYQNMPVPSSKVRIDANFATASYDIVLGRNLDGTSYSGTVQIGRVGHVYNMLWDMRDGKIAGFGVRTDDGLFAAAYGNNVGLAIAVYKIVGNKLDGLITTNQQLNIFVPQVLSGESRLEGTYDIKFPGRSDQKASAVISKNGDAYNVTYAFNQGASIGVGVELDGYFVVGVTAPGQSVGVVAYHPTSGGKRLAGKFTYLGSPAMGVEKLKRTRVTR